MDSGGLGNGGSSSMTSAFPIKNLWWLAICGIGMGQGLWRKLGTLNCLGFEVNFNIREVPVGDPPNSIKKMVS